MWFGQKCKISNLALDKILNENFIISVNLFFFSPIRKPASARAAKKLPVPASFPVTAYED